MYITYIEHVIPLHFVCVVLKNQWKSEAWLDISYDASVSTVNSTEILGSLLAVRCRMLTTFTSNLHVCQLSPPSVNWEQQSTAEKGQEYVAQMPLRL